VAKTLSIGVKGVPETRQRRVSALNGRSPGKGAQVIPVLGGEIMEGEEAFAVSDDQDRQAAVFEAWSRAPHWERHANHIRAMMTEDRVRQTDPRVRLIGREAYTEAGGAVDEDLFGESVYYLDADLLTRMAQSALDAAVDAEIATGWRWGATMLDRDWAALRALKRLYPEEVALSEADQKRWDEINERLENEEMDDAAFNALEAELQALDDKTQAFTDAQKAVSGVVAILADDGAIVFERGLQRPEDVALAQTPDAATDADAGDAAPNDTGGSDGGGPTPAGPRVVLTVGGETVDPTDGRQAQGCAGPLLRRPARRSSRGAEGRLAAASHTGDFPPLCGSGPSGLRSRPCSYPHASGPNLRSLSPVRKAELARVIRFRRDEHRSKRLRLDLKEQVRHPK
jgi:hypothetical protein